MANRLSSPEDVKRLTQDLMNEVAKVVVVPGRLVNVVTR